MIIYALTYTFAFILTRYAEVFKNKYDNSKKKSTLAGFLLCFLGIFILLTLLGSLRYDVGYDYLSYNDNINAYRDNGVLMAKEPLTKLFVILAVKLENGNWLFFFLFNFLTNLGFLLAIFINKDNRFLIRMFVFLFYAMYLTSFNQIRQSFGIAFGILAFSIFYNYKNSFAIILSFIIGIISTLAHYSEILNLLILLILLLFRYFGDKIPMKKLISVGFGIIILSPLIAMLVKVTLENLPLLSQFANYLTPYDNSAPIIVRFFGCLGIYILPIITLFYFIINFDESTDNFMKVIFIYLMASIAFMFVSMLLTNLMFADRARTLIYAFEILSFPYLLSQMKGKMKFSYQLVAMTIMVCINIGTFVVGKMYPYRFIFAKDIIIY